MEQYEKAHNAQPGELVLLAVVLLLPLVGRAARVPEA
jgi:hypothetical protein